LGLSGFPLGVFIGYTITIIISLVLATGQYVPVVPSLSKKWGEIGAVALQFVLSGVLGAVFAAASVIWKNDNWSILKQTVVHFIVLSLTMLPIAYLAHWMKPSFVGVAIYFGIFAAIYVVIWTLQYSIWKHSIERINDRIKSKK